MYLTVQFGIRIVLFLDISDTHLIDNLPKWYVKKKSDNRWYRHFDEYP